MRPKWVSRCPNSMLASLLLRGGANKSLARPGRKEAIATKLGIYNTTQYNTIQYNTTQYNNKRIRVHSLPMNVGHLDKTFVPHNKMSIHWSSVPLLKTSRLRLTTSSGSKKRSPNWCVCVKPGIHTQNMGWALLLCSTPPT